MVVNRNLQNFVKLVPLFGKKRSKKAGLPPGTLVHIGEKKLAKPKITLLDYDENNFEEKEVKKVEECFPFKDTPTVTWINVDGLHETSVIEKLGQRFDFHPLILEDILNTDQRPKFEDFGDYAYIVLKVMYYNEKEERTTVEQVSFILGRNFVISFKENGGDVFNSVKEMIRKGKSRIRKMGADYLVYSLMDAIVDGYFIILEKFGEKIEAVEEKLVKSPKPEILNHIHYLKREMIVVRRAIWPLRDVVVGMGRGGSDLIKEKTQLFLRDIYDHTVQMIDTVETYRDVLSEMIDIYLSSISNRLNEVMKVLTIISTIFIPLTFVAGVYGMNFKYMPELNSPLGYPAILILMLTASIFMIAYFKKKNWF